MKNLLSTICITALTILSLSCSDTTAPTRDFSSIQNPYARWQAYNLKTYTMMQSQQCYCANERGIQLVTVRDNHVVDAVDLNNGQHLEGNSLQQFKTIDELFAIVQSLQNSPDGSVVVEYDARFGYPKKLSADPRKQIIDEEYTYNTSLLEN